MGFIKKKDSQTVLNISYIVSRVTVHYKLSKY
jgi:hypothetical protein